MPPRELEAAGVDVPSTDGPAAPEAVPGARITRWPKRENEICRKVTATCTFNNRDWAARLRLRGAHGLELEFENAADLAAWNDLSPAQREAFTAGMLAALNAADLERIRRENHERRVRDGLRFVTALALRDRQLARLSGHGPAAPVALVAVRRGTPRTHRRNVRTRASAARAPGESSEPPRPDLAQLATAAARCWAHIRRREARARLPA